MMGNTMSRPLIGLIECRPHDHHAAATSRLIVVMADEQATVTNRFSDHPTPPSQTLSTPWRAIGKPLRPPPLTVFSDRPAAQRSRRNGHGGRSNYRRPDRPYAVPHLRSGNPTIQGPIGGSSRTTFHRITSTRASAPLAAMQYHGGNRCWRRLVGVRSDISESTVWLSGQGL
jgi:hypothetical protein